MTADIQKLIWRIEALRDTFHDAVFVRPDLDAALQVCTPDVALVHLPTGTGTSGHRDLRTHLAEDVHGHLPADLAFRRISRSVDQRRLTQENLVTFTHDRELPWLLPGVPATHRTAEVLTFTTVRVQHRSRQGATTTLIDQWRTLWDLASMYTQLALDPVSCTSGG